MESEFLIIWRDNGSVDGILSYGGRRVMLRGENPKTGVLNFFDSDGDTYRLRKTLTPELVIWSGAMNSDTIVYFARPR